MKDSTNIPKPPKVIKNKDGWTWRVVKNAMKSAKLGDEIGFTIGRAHWVLRKGDFSNEQKNTNTKNDRKRI